MKPVVIGTGMVGSAMATLLVGNGYPACVLGLDDAHCEAARGNIQRNFTDLCEKGLVTQAQANAAMARASFVTGYAEIAGADIVFEAVPEKLAVKQDVYRQVEEACSENTVVASVTSAIPAATLGELFRKNKARFLVAHPWNPAHLVPLVEVSKSPHTSEAAVQTTVELLENCGKAVVVLQKELPGFIGNRLQHAMFREALYMVEQGVCTAEDINKAVRASFGPRYSTIDLFEHYDCAGLPLQAEVQSTIFPTMCNAAGPQQVLKDCIARGDLGLKTGKGVLNWAGRDADDFRARQAAPFYAFFNWKLPE